MRYSWLVCETTPRWSKAVRRFGPAALPSSSDALAVTSGTAAQIRPLWARSSATGDVAIVLWVLERARIAEITAALSVAAMPTGRILHLAALDPTLTLRGTAGRRARLALHEWQITAVLDAPEQLTTLLPLIRRHFESIRPEHPSLDAVVALTDPTTAETRGAG